MSHNIKRQIVFKRQEELIKELLLGKKKARLPMEEDARLPMEKDNGSLLLPTRRSEFFTGEECANIRSWIDSQF